MGEQMKFEWQFWHVHSLLLQIFFLKTNINPPSHTYHTQILEKYKLLILSMQVNFSNCK